MYEEKLIQSLIILILFSIAIGVSLNQYKFDRIKAIMITIGFNLILVMSVFISSNFLLYTMKFINNNINFLMIVVGMLSIFIGFRFIYEIKFKVKLPFSLVLSENSFNENFNKKVNSLKKKYKFLKDNLSLPTLFIISFIAIFINLLYISPKVWIPANQLVILFAIVSIAISFLSYILSDKIKFLRENVVGLFLMGSGIYYLIVFMFIPPLQAVLKENTRGINIGDPTLLLYFIIVLIVSLLLGYLIKKSKRFRNLL